MPQKKTARARFFQVNERELRLRRFATILAALGLSAFFPIPSSPAAAPSATSPTVAATGGTTTPAGRAAPRPLVRNADLSMFFPKQERTGNAAKEYIRAFDLYNADRDHTKYLGQWDVLLQRRAMRAALALITSGSKCAKCDFTPFEPDDLDRSSKFPYLVETQTLARLLGERVERELAAGERDKALETARTIMAFGRHLRSSAYVLSQEIQGIAIENLAVAKFRKIYGENADEETSAKLKAMEYLLGATRQYIADEISSHSAVGTPAFSADLAWLRSPHPVLRCEAILNIAQHSLPRSVLVKPTPTIDLNTLLHKLERATTGSKIRITREEVETKIVWPRRGVRSGVSYEDVRRVREILTPVARSDPDPRVRILARRLLDSLIEPPPAPRPAKGSQNKSKTPAGRR